MMMMQMKGRTDTGHTTIAAAAGTMQLSFISSMISISCEVMKV